METFFTCCVQVEAFCEVIHGRLLSTSRVTYLMSVYEERLKTGSPNDRGICFFIWNLSIFSFGVIDLVLST